jgi:hypothetical protein
VVHQYRQLVVELLNICSSMVEFYMYYYIMQALTSLKVLFDKLLFVLSVRLRFISKLFFVGDEVKYSLGDNITLEVSRV